MLKYFLISFCLYCKIGLKPFFELKTRPFAFLLVHNSMMVISSFCIPSNQLSYSAAFKIARLCCHLGRMKFPEHWRALMQQKSRRKPNDLDLTAVFFETGSMTTPTKSPNLTKCGSGGSFQSYLTHS